MIGVSAGLIGYWLTHLKWWERIWSAGAGLLLIIPGWASDTIGLGSLAVLFALQVIRSRKDKPSVGTT